MLYAGPDLSRKRLDFHLLDAAGATVEVGAAAPDGDGLRGLSERVAVHDEPIRAAIESMNGARSVGTRRSERARWRLHLVRRRSKSADPHQDDGLGVLARAYAGRVEEFASQRLVLTRLMLLSVGAGLATIALKMLAWQLTGSTGLFSDALESIVNLAAALMALIVVRWATLPADAEHMYGHEKAEYFSAGVEGGLIMVAAVAIGWVAVRRLLHPAPLEDVGVGLAVSSAASLINLAVGLTLVRAGRRRRSITVEADGRHLLTDVWTSVGVIVGVALVALTGWERLDPLIALAVAANIVFTGVKLVRRSSGGLMDHALAPAEQSAIDAALRPYREEGIVFHAVRNRQAGRRSFISMHVLVPGRWTIQHGHDLLESVEAAVRTALPYSTVFTHIEPVEDPSSFDDTALDRSDRPQAQKK